MTTGSVNQTDRTCDVDGAKVGWASDSADVPREGISLAGHPLGVVGRAKTNDRPARSNVGARENWATRREAESCPPCAAEFKDF